MTMGKGAVQSASKKQKVTTRSLTESELVGADNMVLQVIWTKLFLEEQGYQVKDNVLYRDNQSTMKLEQNGKTSLGKRTRHLNIRYFYITDQIQKGLISIKYCPTDDMIADYMTKLLVGKKFIKFRKEIMGSN